MPLVRARSELLERRQLLTIESVSSAVSVDADEEQVLQSIAADAVNTELPVVVFSDRNSVSGKGDDVYFRRFSPLGGAQTGRQIVNSTNSGAQMNPDVAISSNSNFVVVWQSEGQDGSSWGIYARRFNEAGVAQGGEIQVNTSTAGAQTSPKVAIDSVGNFVVTYVNEASNNGEIIARRFQADGTPIAEFTVSGATTKGYSSPVIAMKSDGTFALAWVMTYLDTDNSTDIQARVYSSAGSAIGSTQAINDAGDQSSPTIAAGNTFFVGWADASSAEATIWYRRLGVDGNWSGASIQANQDSIGNRSRPSLSADANDNVFIAWTQQEQNTLYSSTVYRGFSADGVATSNEIAITDGSSARTLMDIAYIGQGAFLEVTTIGEFVGYGLGMLSTMQNIIRFNGTPSNDSLVAYALNGTTTRTNFNGVSQDYYTSAYAKISVDLGDGGDTVTATDATIMFTVSGGAGNDLIRTGSGFDSISGGDGNDDIFTGPGSDYAIGNSGNDLIYGNEGDDTLTGSAGKDTMYGGDGNDRVAGTGSPDQIFGEGGDDRLYGDDGDDRLDGGGGKDRLYGGENNDYLIGGSSNDRMYGQNGNDTLGGGKGNDYLAGDDGIDTVLGKEPGDTLVDVEFF